MRHEILYWTFAGILLAASTARAQEPLAGEGQDSAPLTVERAAGEIEIDGRLEDPGWRSATKDTLDYEYVPGENVQPPVETTVLLTYDDDHVYVAFRARDPEPDRIRAHLMDRDEIHTLVQDDHVVLMFDTFDDDRRAYQFRVNPLGVQADAFNSEIGGGEDWSFDLIWDSAGRITDEGYVVEIAVPLNQLRFPAADGELSWGIRFGRSWPRSVRHRMANHPVDRDESCVICQFPTVVGFAGIQPGRNLEVTPTLTASRTDERRELPGGDLEEGPEEVEPGITGRWGITPSITLHGTLNPDFSQVEADVAQLNVNERFALFFPEKRPFFLEGSDFFDTPISAVFTRTIVDPAWGLKLTGKQERDSGGLLVAEDDVNSLVLPSNQGSGFAFLEDDVLATIARYRRDVGTGSSLGLLYAGREGTGYHNRVGGLDGFLRFSDSDTLRFQYLRSDTRYPAELGLGDDFLTDDGIEAWYNHSTRSWFWVVGYKDLGPDFRADSGFEPRVDLRTVQASLGRQFWGTEDDWYTRWNVGGNYTRTEDHDGRLTDEDFQVY
ncbi:MAG: DUF5916 domain-containing protein, partial [Thermoanaerobaculia bacterium]|nr:DUF5916 domain-containing protein [Thermoanaerobaculia bacterium]